MLLVLVLSLSVLLVGGITPRLFLPVGALALAGGLFDSIRPAQSRASRLAPALVLACLALYCVVQALPLPLSWVKVLSPAAADVWERCLLPLDRVRETASLSLSPDATLFEAFKWASYAGTFLLSLRMARRYGAPAPLLAVFATAVVVALVSMGHALLSAVHVFGIYEPLHPVEPGDAGPLINPNNLAGYLNLNILIGSGLALSKRPPTSRWLLGTGLIILLAVSLRTASRGGVASLVVGLVAFGIWATFARKAKLASAKIISYATTAALFVGAGFALLGAEKDFWPSLLSENVAKLQLPVWSLPVIKDHPVFGIGRGAFASVFFAYRPQTPGNIAYTHPENVAVQWVAEWGVIVPVVASLVLLWGFWSARQSILRSAVLLGALFGVGVLILQNLVDLGLELAGVGTAVAATLGCVWSAAPRRESASPAPSVWTLRIALGGALVVGCLLLWRGPTNLEEDRASVQRELLAATNSRDSARAGALKERLGSLMERHPADYYFPLVGAYTARQLGENPIVWVQRALERGPTVGRTHLLLAEYLLVRGLSNQGLMEVRLALEYEPTLASTAAPLVVRYASTTEAVFAAVPQGDQGSFALEVFSISFGTAAKLEVRQALDREALVRDPDQLSPRRRLAEDLLLALESKKAPCAIERSNCLSKLESDAQVIATKYPNHTLPGRLRARVELLEGRKESALTILRASCELPEEKLPCLQLLAQTLASLGSSDELNTVLEKVVSTACSQRLGCAETNRWVAGVHVTVGNRQQAVTWYERAARQEPTATRWLELADAADQAGLSAVVAQALGEAATKKDAKEPANAERFARLSEKHPRKR